MSRHGIFAEVLLVGALLSEVAVAGLFGSGGGFNPVRTVSDRVSRAIRPQDLGPSLGRAIRPQDVLPSVKRLSDPANWGPFYEERREALESWVVARGASLWMEPPVLKLVNPGGFSGDPVVYVNGLNTIESEAIEDAAYMSRSLGRPVQLLYNPTNTNELGEAVGTVTDAFEAFIDSIYMPPVPQANHTTRQLTHLLYHNDRPLSLVTHSQGCLIARNAIHTVEFLGEKGRVTQHLAWIAVGSPVNRNMLRYTPARFRDLLIPGDFVGQVLGMKFGYKWYHFYRRRHEFVHEPIRDESTGRVTQEFSARDPNDVDYLRLIELDQNLSGLWPSGNQPRLEPTRRFSRRPILVNETDNELDVRYIRQVAETPQQWFFDQEERTVTVPPNSRLNLNFATQKLRVRAKSGEQRWDHWDQPIEVAPEQGFLTTAESPVYEITFSALRPAEDVEKCYGVENSLLGDGRKWHWFDVTQKTAFRQGDNETEFFKEAMVVPTTLSGTPFSDVDQLYRLNFGYFRIWPKSESVWFVPKSGTGIVWRHDPPSGWIREGRMGSYTASPGSPFGEDDLDEFPDIHTERPNLQMVIEELQRSSWRTQYAIPGGNQSAFLTFDGQRGRYRLPNGAVGELRDVEFKLRERFDQIVILGKWRLGGSGGIFEFKISTTEVVVQRGLFHKFTGNWWRGDGLGPPDGTWDGIRADDTFAFFRVRNSTPKRIQFGVRWNDASGVNQIQLEPGHHTVLSTLRMDDIATAKILFRPVTNQPLREITPPFEIGVAASDGPRWRTLSSLDPTKMNAAEFIPQELGKMEIQFVTQRKNGQTDISSP